MKSPIYTEKTICRDCYKCVRQCPVKAIKVEDGSAVIMHELCIFCGKCIEVCPVNAKKLRSDVSRAKQMIKLNSNVIASVAPSFPAEFDCSASGLITALKKLGFSGVSETSIGAEIVSRHISEEMQQPSSACSVSSACPTVKELIRKYRPELTEMMSDIVSPLHAHAGLLKELYGKDSKVVFLGPCISKKLEADDESTPIDLALTFIELREWFEAENITLNENEYEDEKEHFIPENYVNAAEFAVEGGMLNTIKAGASSIDSNLISCSGMQNIIEIFDNFDELTDDKLFLELLACDGGCISGRGMSAETGYLQKRLRVLKYHSSIVQQQEEKRLAGHRKTAAGTSVSPEVTAPISPDPVSAPKYSEEQIAEVLISIDKRKKEDELNCGGCGYNTCRDFAAALLEGKAEQTMCVTNMRKLAEKKSNALMKALPLGAVITDRNQRILECNRKFISLFSEADEEAAAEAESRITGLELSRFLPGINIFEKLSQSELETAEAKHRINDRVFRTFAFKVGTEEMLGAVFQDITSPAVQRETLVRKTEEVIEKSLSSVQQIASLLGENAAETQLILNSLVEQYK